MDSLMTNDGMNNLQDVKKIHVYFIWVSLAYVPDNFVGAGAQKKEGKLSSRAARGTGSPFLSWF